MKSFPIGLWARGLALSCALALPAAAQQGTLRQRLTLARAYSAATAAAMQEGATAATVDRVLAFLDDSALYEHPLAGARIRRIDIGEGMRSHLGDTRNAQVKIVGELVKDAGVELVEDVRFEIRVGGRWQPMHRRQVRVLQFAGSKIIRVIEVWLPDR